jgi:hypothetical protein
MSITAVPISIVRVRAPTAARSGNGELSWRAKWCTRKYAPSAPSSSAATASSTDCRSASAAERTAEPYESDQCPNDKNPIFFNAIPPHPAVSRSIPARATFSNAWLS